MSSLEKLRTSQQPSAEVDGVAGSDHLCDLVRLSGMAAVLDTRLRQAQAEKMTPIDLVSALVADELRRR